MYNMWVKCSYLFNIKYQGIHAQLANRFCLFPIVLKIYLCVSSLFIIPDAEILVT